MRDVASSPITLFHGMNVTEYTVFVRVIVF